MKPLKFLFLLSLSFLLSQSCNNSSQEKKAPATEASATREPTIPPQPKRVYKTFDRKDNIEKLKKKIQQGESISIHLSVPLCDNENQGIVPVSKKLGDGLDLRNNLYWGAMYGVKNYFKNKSPWTLLEAIENPEDAILERLIFYREFPNRANVYLIADAYRGDRMKACLMDFMHSMAGRKKEEITVGTEPIKINGGADLLVFNGHNGLMDYDLEFVETVDEKVRDVSVIGCVSHDYFVDHLKHSKGYPVLMTTNLMAPESYVLHALFDSWVLLKEESDIRRAAGQAYHDYQKCGLKGATRLFRTGW